jgi:broad specificity phosphatase PhoE
VIYFTRHGESLANVADRELLVGQGDTDQLSERGFQQARSVGERLRGEGLERILASPYTRAEQTAQAIADVLGGLPVETDDDLHEVRQSDAYRAAAPDYAGTGYIRWMTGAEPSYAEPGAESFAGIVARVDRVQARLASRTGAERLLCVSHWGFLHFFLGRTLFREEFAPAHLPALFRVHHANTGISVFDWRSGYLLDGEVFDGWALKTWNDQAHL